MGGWVKPSTPHSPKTTSQSVSDRTALSLAISDNLQCFPWMLLSFDGESLMVNIRDCKHRKIDGLTDEGDNRRSAVHLLAQLLFACLTYWFP